MSRRDSLGKEFLPAYLLLLLSNNTSVTLSQFLLSYEVGGLKYVHTSEDVQSDWIQTMKLSTFDADLEDDASTGSKRQDLI